MSCRVLKFHVVPHLFYESKKSQSRILDESLQHLLGRYLPHRDRFKHPRDDLGLVGADQTIDSLIGAAVVGLTPERKRELRHFNERFHMLSQLCEM